MSEHFHREITKLNERFIQLGLTVENRVTAAIDAFVTRDLEKAKRVVDGDREIDEAEVDLEEECLKLLALHQPVASDLRFLISVLKINANLERVGDLAVNICQRTKKFVLTGYDKYPPQIEAMSVQVTHMLRESLASLVELSLEKAKQLLPADDQVDALNREVYKWVAAATRKTPENIEVYLLILSVSKQLERIADHAANIAEDVIYFLEGGIVRHHRRRQRSEAMGPDDDR